MCSIHKIPNPEEKQKENNKPIFLIIIDGNIISEILANTIQEHIEETINLHQTRFLLQIQAQSTLGNQ